MTFTRSRATLDEPVAGNASSRATASGRRLQRFYAVRAGLLPRPRSRCGQRVVLGERPGRPTGANVSATGSCAHCRSHGWTERRPLVEKRLGPSTVPRDPVALASDVRIGNVVDVPQPASSGAGLPVRDELVELDGWTTPTWPTASRMRTGGWPRCSPSRSTTARRSSGRYTPPILNEHMFAYNPETGSGAPMLPHRKRAAPEW